MKSKGAYEMHNYAAIISTNLIPSDAFDSVNEDITTKIAKKINATKTTAKNEKYSLRQRQKRRNTSALPIAADSPGYASDENNNNNLNNNNSNEQDYFYAQKTTSTPTKTKTKNSTKRKKLDNSNHAYTTSSAMTSALSTVLSTSPKAKTKAAPLSKYRRKTANARERTRMREINSAFENLRHCVPHTITGGDVAAQTNEKLTKITTLRLAMKYISILNEALANPTFGEDFLQECKRDGDHRFTSEAAPMPYITPTYDELEIETTPPLAKKSKSHAKSKTTKTNATARTASTTTTKKCTSGSVAKPPNAKRQTKKQKLAPYADAYSSAASTCSSHFSSSASVSSSSSSPSSSSAYATLSSAASSIAGGSPSASSAFLLDSPVSAAYMHNMVSVHQSMSDLSSLMLESDGESMQLSEPCLSPLQSSYHLLGGGVVGGTSQHNTVTTTNSAATNAHATLSSFDTSSSEEHIALSSLESPLELSLRLLDSSADSLDFNVHNSDQHAPPSSCISPLVTLDSFNPFADLLHSDFPEHSPLDLFLA